MLGPILLLLSNLMLTSCLARSYRFQSLFLLQVALEHLFNILLSASSRSSSGDSACNFWRKPCLQQLAAIFSPLNRRSCPRLDDRIFSN